MAAIGYAVTFGITLVGGTIFSGWVLTVLWLWFVVPTFRLAPITLAPAIGLSLVVRFLVWQTGPDVETKKRETAELLARAFALALIPSTLALAMGWVVHLFMSS